MSISAISAASDHSVLANANRPLPTRKLIQLEAITKVFLTEELETHALSEVHLSVHAGEWVAVVGPSGSGKTTLLAILGLLDTPSKGSYLLDGKSVSGLAEAERTKIRNLHIGFIFQSFNLIGDLTVFENVELPLVYGGVPAAQRKARVERALERVGMSHRRKHMPGQLSGGQQQRVAVARAVAGEPLLLLADEPTGNLDSKNGQVVMDLLHDLHSQGSTLCMVTHDPTHAKLATRRVSLFDGRVVQDELANNGPHL